VTALPAMKLVSTLAALAGLCAAAPSLADTVNLPYEMGGVYSLPVTSIKSARFRAMVRQQYDFSCGSAALSTLLTYHYGYKVSEEQIFAEMYAKGDQPKIRAEGFSLFDMKRYLENHGFQADGFEAPLEKLAEAGIPAIVLINENGYNHFVVIKGLRDGRVLIGDPSTGTRVISRNRFNEIWANNILFVVKNKLEVARFNADRDWQAAPASPIAAGHHRGTADYNLPKRGPADF